MITFLLFLLGCFLFYNGIKYGPLIHFPKNFNGRTLFITAAMTAIGFLLLLVTVIPFVINNI